MPAKPSQSRTAVLQRQLIKVLTAQGGLCSREVLAVKLFPSIPPEVAVRTYLIKLESENRWSAKKGWIQRRTPDVDKQVLFGRRRVVNYLIQELKQRHRIAIEYHCKIATVVLLKEDTAQEECEADYITVKE